MYRPTVRYDDAFKDYVDCLFHATHLDRNQLIRAALFAAPYSKEFQALLQPYQKRDVPLPSPTWKADQDGYWLEQCPNIKGGSRDVNANIERERKADVDPGAAEGRREQQAIRRIGPAEGRKRTLPSQPIRVTGGGISFTIN